MHELQRALDRVASGELTIVQAGEFLTSLNFDPDFDAVTDERVAHVIEDLGPDLEVENGDPQVLWKEIESVLQEVLLGE